MTSNPTATSRAARRRRNSISPAVLAASPALCSRPWTDSASTLTTPALSGPWWATDWPSRFLEQVYETNHIDCVMQHAEAQATLNDVCAVQVKCTNDPDKPVDLQLWGGDEFTVFTDPEDPRQAFAVVTIDRYNQRTRYKLWFEDEVRTYLTDQYIADKTAGARVAIQARTGERNTYGCIPFAFLHYRAPVRQFWTPGPGTFLRKAELRINDRLSELDELISKYGRPIGVFRNVSPTFTPEIGPGRFMRLCRGGTGYTGEGYADGGEPSAEYLQAQLAIESIWVDLEKYMKQVATAVNLPYTALELQYEDAPSRDQPDHQGRAAAHPGEAAAADLPARRDVPGPQDPDRVRQPLRPRRSARAGEAAPAPARLGRAPHPDPRPRPRPVRRVGDAGRHQVAGSPSAWTATGSIATRRSSTSSRWPRTRPRPPRSGRQKQNPVAPPKEEAPEEDDVSGAAPEEDEPDNDVTGPQSTSEASD